MSVTATIAATLSSAKVVSAIESLAGAGLSAVVKEASKTGTSSILSRLKPSDRKRAAKESLRLFAEEWLKELDDTCPLTSALRGYQDQLELLIEASAPELAELMDPEITSLDLGPIQRIWSGIASVSLPEEFDWDHVARNYYRAIKRHFKTDSELRSAYEIVLQERSADATVRAATAIERIAGIAPNETFTKLRDFLIEKKCNALQLATMHFSTYGDDRRMHLWSIFVPQLARESAPIVNVPPELLRQLREEGEITKFAEEGNNAELLRKYHSSPLRPVIEVIEEKAHVVVVGDPGAGKSALLKYLCLRWAKQNSGPVPILIDLKEYGKNRMGLLQFCQSGLAMPAISVATLDSALSRGEAALYLDGLDEIFDSGARHSVVLEIGAISTQYADSRIVVTSRKVGYQPEHLSEAGFSHATLEDFDRQQVSLFLNQWYEAAEDDEEKRKLLNERLKKAITDSSSIRELASNPLLLTMMAILNRSQELPRNRVALYRKASEVLLHEWDANRALLTVESFDREDKEFLLRELAGDMQQEKSGLAGNLIERKRLIRDFESSLQKLGLVDSHTKSLLLVKQLEERNFILASAGAGVFSFVHRTFLEYFCASWFVNRLQHTRELTLDDLKESVFGGHWKDDKWQEVLRLISGMISEKDAGDVVSFLIEQDGSAHNNRNLILASACLYEIRNRKAVALVESKLWSLFIEKLINDGETSSDFYASSGDPKDSSCALAIHWLALAWRGERAETWLREAARIGVSPIIRWAAIHELSHGWGEVSDLARLFMDLATTEQFWTVLVKIVEELSDTFGYLPEVFEWLAESASSHPSDWVRRECLTQLSEHWKEAPKVVEIVERSARTEEDWFVRNNALRVLARTWKSDPETYLIFQEALSSDSERVRSVVVMHWLKVCPDEEQGIRKLRSLAATDPSDYVRLHVGEAISTASRVAEEGRSLMYEIAEQSKNMEARREGIRLLRRRWPNDERTVALKDEPEQSEDLEDTTEKPAKKSDDALDGSTVAIQI